MHRVRKNISVRRRTLSVVLPVAVAALAAPLGPASAEAAGPRLDRAERALERAIDRARESRGVRGLRVDPRLGRAADAHCRDMLRSDFFAHTSSDGSSMTSRLRRYRPSRRLGETLAYLPARKVDRRRAARRIVRMWLSSPGHRAVMLSGRFRRVGVARRAGRLGSRRAAVYTVDFASRR